MLFGPVAQLGERTVRIRKVESSILFGSTTSEQALYRLLRFFFFCGLRGFDSLCQNIKISFSYPTNKKEMIIFNGSLLFPINKDIKHSAAEKLCGGVFYTCFT